MKKFFTSALLMMLGVMGMNAQTTLIDYPTSKDGIAISGTTVETTVKIHENSDAVACLQLKNGYTSDGKMNDNYIELTVEGGFKTGDVITIAGAINNSDAAKRATAVIFTADEDGKPTVIHKFSDFINGKLVAGDPVVEEYTLEADFDKLYIGRDGGTAASLTLIKVVRPEQQTAPSLNGKLVIGKVFYAGSTRLNGATPKNYMKHLYIELYNNSAEAIDVAGLYIGMANSDAAANAWTAAAMAAEHPDSAVVKQIFQIPASAPVLVEAGKSVVITNCAIDHSEIAEGNVNLSDADFEVKSANAGFSDHSESVPELPIIKTFGTTDFINFLNPGPVGIVLLPADTDIDNCPATYPKGKTSGNTYTIVPMKNSIDCVDIVKQKTPSADDKRFAEAYDAGFTCTADPGTYNCQAVARKVASVEGGRNVLKDTNNSTDDFEVLSNVEPRVYGEGVVTGIQTVNTTTVENNGIFNLQGQRMNSVQKGLYIINGKKVVIK